ncbi:MAG: hypothetical protein WC458_00040 [Patescibacteria group bacterium]
MKKIFLAVIVIFSSLAIAKAESNSKGTLKDVGIVRAESNSKGTFKSGQLTTILVPHVKYTKRGIRNKHIKLTFWRKTNNFQTLCLWIVGEKNDNSCMHSQIIKRRCLAY